ncbi:MAG TPA: T9SS type A sorting domain-containing protein, partial [Candidatus Kapabacteria bacterium]
SFFTTRDSFITYWVHGLSIGGGNALRTEWYQPSGALWSTHLDTLDQNIRYWYYYNHVNGPAVQANMPLGTWKVRFFVQNQPFDSLTFVIGVLGVQTQREKHVAITPNPARDYILVSGDYKDIKLFDALGREQKLNVNYFTNPIRIDLNGLPSGAYNLQLKDAQGQVAVEKVIVE